MNSRLAELIDPRSLRLLLGGCVLLLCAAISVYWIKPLWLQYQQLQQSNARMAAAVADGPALSEKIQQRYATMSHLEEQLYGSSGAVPARQIESYVIGSLQSISWSLGVKLDSVKPLPAKPILQFNETPFEVVLSGSYFDLFSWLQAVDRELGFIVVDTLNVTPSGGDRSGQALRMSLRMASYRVAQP